MTKGKGEDNTQTITKLLPIRGPSDNKEAKKRPSKVGKHHVLIRKYGRIPGSMHQRNIGALKKICEIKDIKEHMKY